MRIDCEAAREAVDAYVIGALDRDELPAFEAHLASCADCTQLAADARDTAAAVALTVPIVPASSALKARLMASAAVLSSGQRSPRALRRITWWPATAAALLVLSIGALTWGIVVQRQADGLRTRNDAAVADATDASAQLASLSSWQDSMLDVASQADVRGTALAGTALAPSAHGQYIWSASEARGAFLGTGLPPLPAGKTYQFWFVYGAAWESAGTCAAGADGRAHLIVQRPTHDDGDPGPVKGFAVTIEPSGGAADRTGALVLQSTLN